MKHEDTVCGCVGGRGKATWAAAVVSAVTLALAGCDSKGSGGGAPPQTASSSGGDHDGHDHDGHDHEGHDHDGHDHDGHDHGPETKLGEQLVGGFTVVAARDGGITPGSDAPVDVNITGAAGAKVNAVRLWIGTQDAKGSVKAKAAQEDDRWHAHVEIPKPLPESSKLWVEIEPVGAAKVVVGFELKG